jgi:hypothetical protein
MSQTLCSKESRGSLRRFLAAEFHLFVLMLPLQIAVAVIANSWGLFIGLIGFELLAQLSHEFSFHRADGPLTKASRLTFSIGLLLCMTGAFLLLKAFVDSSSRWIQVVLCLGVVIMVSMFSEEQHLRRHRSERYSGWGVSLIWVLTALAAATLYRFWPLIS